MWPFEKSQMAGVSDLHLLCTRLRPGTDPPDDFLLADAVATGAGVRTIRPHLYREFPIGSLPGSFRTCFSALHPLLAATVRRRRRNISARL